MKSRFSVLIFIFCVFQVKAQNETDRITWSSQSKLKFKDFTGVPKAIVYSAISSLQFNYDYLIDFDTLEYNIFAFFLKKNSWMKTNNAELLCHEQLHFDISEVYSRRIKRKIRVLSGQYVNDSIIHQIFTEEHKNNVTIDSIFDAQTSHGKNDRAGKLWSEKIQKMLDSLDEYKEPVGKIPILPR